MFWRIFVDFNYTQSIWYPITKYGLEGDKTIIDNFCRDIQESIEVFRKIKKLAIPYAKSLNIELNEQTWKLRGKKKPYFFIGTEANELQKSTVMETIPLAFEKIGLKPTHLEFFVFYLPPVMVALSNKGIETTTLGGFTNIEKNNRTEINIHPTVSQDFFRVFEDIVHEAIHNSLLKNNSMKFDRTSVEHNEELEKTFEEAFFTSNKTQLQHSKPKISEELNKLIKTKKEIFQKLNSSLSKHKDVEKLREQIAKLEQHFKKGQQGKIRLKEYTPRKLTFLERKRPEW